MRSFLRRDRRGSNAIEFALTVPVLVAMLAGIADYGWFFNQQQSVVAAVREGARAGALAPRNQDPRALAADRARASLDNAGLDSQQATVVAEYIDAPPNLLVGVDVSLPYTPLMGLVPTPERLHSRLSARVEDQ